MIAILQIHLFDDAIDILVVVPICVVIFRAVNTRQNYTLIRGDIATKAFFWPLNFKWLIPQKLLKYLGRISFV